MILVLIFHQSHLGINSEATSIMAINPENNGGKLFKFESRNRGEEIAERKLDCPYCGKKGISQGLLSWINLLTGTEKIHHVHNFKEILKILDILIEECIKFYGMFIKKLRNIFFGSFGTSFYQKRP